MDYYEDIFTFELGLLRKNKRSLRDMLIGAGQLLKHLLSAYKIISFQKSIQPEPPQKAILCFISSKNNYESVKFLKNHFEEFHFLAINDFAKKLEPDASRVSFHYALPYLFKLPLIWIKLLKHYGIKPILHTDIVAKTIGIHEAFPDIISKYNPKAVLFSNDHYPRMRALIHACNKAKIPTIYLQHASVSESFPPLIFDLSLLEGEDTLNKYRTRKNVSGKVELIGMPKFDRYHMLKNTNGKVQNIGICPSVADNKTKIEELVRGISYQLNDMKVSFRPHPRDTRDFELPKEIGESNPNEESGLEFISRQDLIIAGVTSIHLEAMMLNVYSMHYDLDGFHSDFYGYVKNNLVDEFLTIDELVSGIIAIKDKRPNVLDRCKFYNAVIGTEYEGKSQALAAEKIRELLSTNAES